MPATRANPRPAFTLIELLVVISIIALLVGILVPTLSSSRDAARRVKCLANLRGTGVGVSLYMDQESKGLLPKVRPLNSGSNTNDPSLLDVMAKYTDAPVPFEKEPGVWAVSDPWRCPSDTDGTDAATNFRPLWSTTGTSYEYVPGLVMIAAELFTVKNVQFGVSKAFEANPDIPIFIDADDWHNARFRNNRRDAGGSDSEALAEARWDRNGLFLPDYRAAKAPFRNQDQTAALIADTVRFGGGLGGG